MCGICGQFNFKNHAPVDAESIRAMMRTIVHRGPDDEGLYLSGSLGLGFRRLSIIDLSLGHQPMSDEKERTWVVFNGEIYNFKELRQELEGHGYVFRTQCDTEVIVHGYRHWGESVLEHLNGMFGLAIWDEPERKLLLARDPMGIKPLYYASRNGALYFGSEIRAVLAGMREKPETDPLALNLFLRYRYTPSPFTMFQGIRKLAPGEMLSVQNGHVSATRWYRFEPKPYSPMPSDEEAVEMLLELYKAAVKRHLISDVPLGLLLSGGIDSALLLALMNLYGNVWPTFTVGYGHSYKDDELEDAAETARVFSADNVPVMLSRQTFEKTLPGIVEILEEPVATSSIVPMYFVSQRARRDVKVALIGQGPDELFGGYTRHLGVRYGSLWRKLPEGTRSFLSSAAGILPRSETLKRGVYALGIQDRIKRYQHVFSILPGETVDSLFQEGLLPENPGDMVFKCWDDLSPAIGHLDELGGFQLLELRSSLPDELLMYADKMSMIHALEVRIPYLDREIVEHVQRLGSRFKVRNGCRKWLHRRVCRKFLPEGILRRKKRGFAVNVVDQWFREAIGARMEAHLVDESSLMFRYLKPDVVRRLLSEHRTGKNDNHKILFSLVVFETWLRSLR
ncbi:MAG TPA: asparagine synthase (glutamine-hydrolyzing) [Syntrophales bacterium]|nr:asparagine synthase (glutamine-hydrolyzing) [Syntrophales bacterium]HQN78058.1 asparagine synthase (glutamine-hydrolyzing) [Syntrophales bacterium]